MLDTARHLDAMDSEARASDLCAEVAKSGFVHIDAAAMKRELMDVVPVRDADREQFRESWNRLLVDPYMGDGGTYRRRRHSVFTAAGLGGAVARAPHRPHFQTVDNNPLNGGIARHFEPMEAATLENRCFESCLTFAASIFCRLQPFAAWDIEVHQFRIDALSDQGGHPTPEGAHQDGVDYVLMMLVARENVRGGETSITALDGDLLSRFTLVRPFEAAVVDDRRVAHGVSPITRLTDDAPGYRDVLVVTFKRV